jgi:hypothetical protein
MIFVVDLAKVGDSFSYIYNRFRSKLVCKEISWILMVFVVLQDWFLTVANFPFLVLKSSLITRDMFLRISHHMFGFYPLPVNSLFHAGSR